jgi:hypothetical protein
MSLASCIAPALLAAASPALATGTILCRSTISPAAGPSLSLTVGTSVGTGVLQARLTHGAESLTAGTGAGAPVIGQSWLDNEELKLDILDANADAHLARLDTRRLRGLSYVGTLSYRGRTWQVRCDEAG